MFLYENDVCPVCSKPFEKGDDIVTCPECGTPHHRDCYQDYGGCKNRSLHGTDFVYKRGSGASAIKVEKSFKYSPFLSELPNGEQEAQSEYYVPENAENAEIAEIPDAVTEIPEAAPEANVSDEAVDEIDGVKTEDVVSVIAVNSVKFLPKFRKNRLFNWNWSAFVFGPYYLFFRKMYVQGAVFMALEYGMRFAVSAFFMSAYIAASKVLQNAATFQDRFEAAQAFMQDPEFINFATATAIRLVCLVLLHILCALLADNLYRKKVLNIIHIVDEKVKMGESFSLMGPIMAIESNMSQKDMRKIFLSRQGGVNPWAPFFAVILVELFLYML